MRRRRDAVQIQRIGSIDALRGLCLVLMVIYHFAYDLVTYSFIPEWIVLNALIDALVLFFAGLFVLISGTCSRFSHANIPRGLKVLAVAIVVTLASWAFGNPIWWGILHLLGTAMLLYGLLGNLFEKLPNWFKWIWLAVFFITLPVLFRTVEVPNLWIIGLRTSDFYSGDYFPLVPWLFLFFFGAGLGGDVRAHRLPERFYSFKAPVFEKIGRKSIWIYLLHQPVLMGVIYVLKWING